MKRQVLKMRLHVANMRQANGFQTRIRVRRADFNVKLVSISYIYKGFSADKNQPKIEAHIPGENPLPLFFFRLLD